MGLLSYQGGGVYAGRWLGWALCVYAVPGGYNWEADRGDGYPMVGQADDCHDAARAARMAVETAVFGK